MNPAMPSRPSSLLNEALLALMLWICSLPLVAWLIGHYLGWLAAVTVAGVLLIVLLLICSGALRRKLEAWVTRNHR